MKRILIIMLALACVFTFASCKNGGGDDTTAGEAPTSDNSNLVYSDQKYSDEELLTFTDGDKTYTAQLNSAIIQMKGACSISGIMDGSVINMSDTCEGPFKTVLGGSLQSFVDGYRISSGFMSVNSEAGDSVSFTSVDDITVNEADGAAYCYIGFGRDSSGAWSLMDYRMIGDMISGSAAMNTDAQIILICFVIDTDKNVKQVVDVYGTFPVVMTAMGLSK